MRNLKIGVKVNTVCFLGNVVIISNLRLKQLNKITSSFKWFLNERGLILQSSTNSKYNFTFQPATKINYLGFTIQYSNFKNIIFRMGKSNKYKSFFLKLQNTNLKTHNQALTFLNIGKEALNRQKSCIRGLLQRRIIPKSPRCIINMLNQQIIKFSNYFNLSKQTKVQLKKLSHSTYLKIKRRLYQKFTSKPKTRTYVRQKFLINNTIIDNNIKLLKYENFKPYSNSDIKDKSYFDSMEHKYYNKVAGVDIYNKVLSNHYNVLYNNKKDSFAQLKAHAINCQNFLCIACNKYINLRTREHKLIKKPSIYILKKVIRTNILKILCTCILNKKFTAVKGRKQFDLITLKLSELKAFKHFIYKTLYKPTLFFTHKKCSQLLRKIIIGRYVCFNKQFCKSYYKASKFLLEIYTLIKNFKNKCKLFVTSN